MRYFFILMIALFLFTQKASAIEGCSEDLRVGWTDIPPAFYGNELRQPIGLDMDILGLIFARLGCHYEPRHIPFKRYIASIKYGDIDMVMSASKNAERETYGYFSVPYRRERMVLFTTPEYRDSAEIDSFDALVRSSARVAAGIGMWLGEDFHARYRRDPAFKARVLLVEEYSAMLKALVANRFDVMAGDEIGVRYLINSMALEGQVVALPVAIHDNNVHFMFSKKTTSKAFVHRFDREVEAFLGSPEHIALLEKYPVGDPLNLLPRGVVPK